ncbi:MAG TPA: AAA family ATPase [Solirubrobacterales bacterium]|nr:AAA family ATPase [Solirubrobacterales bacterium]
MGFLSRKKKPQPVVEDNHPLEEELRGMEEAVPEAQYVDAGAPAAGPVADEYSSSSQAAGEEHPSAPPADEAESVERGFEESPAAEDGFETPRTEEESYEAPEQDAPVNEAPPVEQAAPAAPVAPAQPEVAVNASPVNDDDAEGDGRMKAIDLIAPTRLDFLKPEPVEPEVPIDQPDVIAFANQKGGVAKTTTTLNLAVAFAESGYRVLCIDLDPQGNLTMSQGIDPDKVEHSLYDVLVNDMPLSEIIVRREIDIAVASIDLAGAEIAMSTKIGRERTLQKALKEVAADYDYVCIDTPPSLGLLTINALTAANKVIVPVQCEYLSMRGLVQLQNTLRMIQENLNPDVRIEGILPTMLDTRTLHAKEAVEILEENFGDLVFQSRIRKAIKFAEAPVKGASVLKYDSESSAAGYYRELAKEVLANGSA